MNNKNFQTFQSLLDYITKNPPWLLGFVDGEGCFTSSFYTDIEATWGVFPQCEFNITQSTIDKLLLTAINAFLIILDQYMIKLMVFPFFHLEI